MYGRNKADTLEAWDCVLRKSGGYCRNALSVHCREASVESGTMLSGFVRYIHRENDTDSAVYRQVIL